ncbi:hypothetical protein CAAN1_03S05732 [[Candida] anglica]|uniref:Restriction of telomere capping protein 4 n=1 Tax=[Candida] anglica TaxID=148631 RepID=A0ABP0EH64_9ASCO
MGYDAQDKYGRSSEPHRLAGSTPGDSIDRHDRVNNMKQNATTTKKRIRGHRGLPIINTLDSKRRKKEKVESPFSSSPPTSRSVEHKDEYKRIPPSILNNFNTKKYSYEDEEKSSANEASDSDIDGNLIEVGKFSSSPFKSHEKDVEELDRILSQETTSNSNDHKLRLSEQTTPDLAAIVAKGDFMATLEGRKKYEKKLMEEKYKDAKYPKSIISKQRLVNRIEKYLKVVPQILKGKLDTCYIYPMAKRQYEQSTHETMTQQEKWDIDWQKYFGGYFGFQRQSFIASRITTRYYNELNMASKKNSLLNYWTISGFATFVLANEVIIRLIMEDYQCEFDKAEKIMKESTEYGVAVSDEIDMIDDLVEAGSIIDTREEDKEKKDNLVSESEKPSTTEHHDVLDLIMNVSDKDSSDDE